MNHIINEALRITVPQFRLDLHHGWHGIAHWSRVWVNAREMCEAMGVDPQVPCWFAFLHDSQRFDEGSDSSHGPRAVAWLNDLYAHRRIEMKPRLFHQLCIAINGHSSGGTAAEEVVQICWDADRLDLGRVGIRPNPMYLCTEYAKRPDVIERAFRRSIGEPQKSDRVKLAA